MTLFATIYILAFAFMNVSMSDSYQSLSIFYLIINRLFTLLQHTIMPINQPIVFNCMFVHYYKKNIRSNQNQNDAY